jgi:3-oxoacyl-[acyl-carrier protein] reductase
VLVFFFQQQSLTTSTRTFFLNLDRTFPTTTTTTMAHSPTSTSSSLLIGKYAIVTGGSRGIGESIALNLASRGCSGIAITYISSPSRANSVVTQLTSLGCRAIAIKADILSPTFGPDIMSTALQFFSGSTIDIIINNAALADVSAQEPFTSISPTGFSNTFLGNLYAPLSLIRASLPHLPPSGGRIINISSIASREPCPDPVMIYGASKAALDSLTRSLATAYAADKRATFNSISVGGTSTDAQKSIMEAIPREMVDMYERKQTAEHRFGMPEDVAMAVGWLCTEEARWINGASVPVNGGGMIAVQG